MKVYFDEFDYSTIFIPWYMNILLFFVKPRMIKDGKNYILVKRFLGRVYITGEGIV